MEGLSASPYMPVLWLGWYGARPDRNEVGMTVGLLDTLTAIECARIWDSYSS